VEQYVRAITSMSPAQLRAAFGTALIGEADATIVVLNSLPPKTRQHVRALMSLTPAQLRAGAGGGW
jgi:hypothetical protein